MSARTLTLCAVLAIGLMGTSAYAQDETHFEKGDRTLTFGGSGGSDKDFDTSYISVQIGTAWFLSDNVSLGLRQEVSFLDLYGSDEWSGSTRLGVDYVFSAGNYSPYVGANIGYLYGDRVNDQFIAGPDVGIRCFLNDTTFISMAVEYQFLFEDADDAEDSFDEGRLAYVMGIGLKL